LVPLVDEPAVVLDADGDAPLGHSPGDLLEACHQQGIELIESVALDHIAGKGPHDWDLQVSRDLTVGHQLLHLLGQPLVGRLGKAGVASQAGRLDAAGLEARPDALVFNGRGPQILVDRGTPVELRSFTTHRGARREHLLQRVGSHPQRNKAYSHLRVPPDTAHLLM